MKTNCKMRRRIFMTGIAKIRRIGTVLLILLCLVALLNPSAYLTETSCCRGENGCNCLCCQHCDGLEKRCGHSSPLALGLPAGICCPVNLAGNVCGRTSIVATESCRCGSDTGQGSRTVLAMYLSGNVKKTGRLALGYKGYTSQGKWNHSFTPYLYDNFGDTVCLIVSNRFREDIPLRFGLLDSFCNARRGPPESFC